MFLAPFVLERVESPSERSSKAGLRPLTGREKNNDLLHVNTHLFNLPAVEPLCCRTVRQPPPSVEQPHRPPETPESAPEVSGALSSPADVSHAELRR